jgi:hypothetical protein
VAGERLKACECQACWNEREVERLSLWLDAIMVRCRGDGEGVDADVLEMAAKARNGYPVPGAEAPRGP